MTEGTKYIINLVGNGILALVCLWGFGYSIRLIFKYIKTASWPKTQGNILESKIVIDTSGDGVAYIPNISYSYSVDDKKYISKNVYLFSLWLSKRHAEYLTKKFKQGDTVAVSFNPNNPEDATLITGYNRLHYNAFTGIIFFLVCGVYFAASFITLLTN